MSFREYLPSKQFAKFVGIALLVGGLVFIGIKIIDSKTGLRQDIQNIATREIIEEQDTDNDGVKDWEEALWGLDKEKSDTDGDGILDGQEVEEKRAELRTSEDFVDVSEEPKTETEQIARQLLTIALNINQTTGGSLSEGDIASLAAELIPSIQAEEIKMYSLGDLTISTTKSAQEYYNEMSEIFKPLETLPTNELSIIEQAINLDREDTFKELNPIIETYASLSEKSLEKQIPSQVALYHLDYINALTQKAIALVSIAQYFKDPVIALRGVEEYKIADENLTEATQNIAKYFQISGIVR